MSNFAPAASLVQKSEAGQYLDVLSGVTVPLGDVCYLDTNNGGVAKLAKANGTALESTVAGIAANGCNAAGQPLRLVMVDPLFTPGFTVSSGVPIFLSTTPGKMCPLADLGTTNWSVLVGIAGGSSKLNLRPVQGGQIS